MKVLDTIIPQSAIDAGHAAMTGRFKARAIQDAVGVALDALVAAGAFSYGKQRKDGVDMRTADRLIQAARKRDAIRFTIGGHWVVA